MTKVRIAEENLLIHFDLIITKAEFDFCRIVEHGEADVAILQFEGGDRPKIKSAGVFTVVYYKVDNQYKYFIPGVKDTNGDLSLDFELDEKGAQTVSGRWADGTDLKCKKK